MANKILHPKLDYVFKLIFGDSWNIDILEAFLKAALDIPADEYDGLVIADPHLKPETTVQKCSPSSLNGAKAGTPRNG
ncbi:PD-(D/E)XK nuclease family transposase [Leadbettera azotonutricia]|uniref:PD-(D/E)XK nuclease family transposase n=1 Tax=Leadbettera azotonutricia TaxID=150829 RepID=UPI00030E8FB2|nr:PD-(D/E)XK nuclease family transposase [Leadbettera azotonutricia]